MVIETRSGFSALLLGSLALAACAQIVGITDTKVSAENAGAAGSGGSSGQSSGGDAGKASGGSAGLTSGGNAGQSAGGTSSGGSAAGGSSGSNPGGASNGGAGACSACPPDKPTCEAGVCAVRGPTMVQADSFYIDSTEVTVAQYQAFIADKNGDTSGQPASCSWNTSFSPDPVTEALGGPNDPMDFVDWCDAAAFCAWADKRLCGSITGGPVSDAFVQTPSISQWLYACGGSDEYNTPTINGMTMPACNDGNASFFEIAGTTCEGSYPGLFDMEGNAEEWVDSCDGETGAGDLCASLGGSYVGASGDFCNEKAPYARNARMNPLGFRCCSK